MKMTIDELNAMINQPMTPREFEAMMKDLLTDVPATLASFISSSAYERGHSSGYEEVIHIVEVLVSDLAPVIEEMTCAHRALRIVMSEGLTESIIRGPKT